MRSPSAVFVGFFAALPVFALACSPDPSAPPATERNTSTAGILTSFDRLTLARGEAATFRASLIGSDARLSSAGLTVFSRAASVAGVSAANGRTRVQGLTAGRTWVVVQSAGAADSVEVLVE